MGPLLIGAILAGIIGALIGRNKKIGAGWAFVLCFFLGIIGIVITAFSKKVETEFVDVNKNE